MLAVVLVLASCSTASPIKPVDESTSNFDLAPSFDSAEYPDDSIYRIYHRAATGFVSIESLRQSAESRAEAFAERRGKTFVVLAEKTSNPPYILGNFPRIELVFALKNKEPAQTDDESRSKGYQQLETIKRLYDEGVLTREEFENEKSKILSE